MQPQIFVKSLYKLLKKTDPYYTLTTPTKFTQMVLRVTRGEKFTPMEKLVKPFDLATWITLIVTLIIALIVISILKVLPKFIYNFVCGSNNNDPILGLTEIFFGIGLIQTPGRNFSRFMFMMFTILCLIIRTAYQSKMYDFLQYDVKQPIANSIQEVIDKQIPVKYMDFTVLSDDRRPEEKDHILKAW